MILITGGAFQGKEHFARKLYQERKSEEREVLILSDSNVSREALLQADIWLDFHLWVSEQLKNEKDPWKECQWILKRNPLIIICVNELGCGIVPVDKFDRTWRETTGRICCRLAEEAEDVYRLICGIASKIK